jgi:hypothetical protein
MITTSNTPLNVPFKEKDEAKSLGARWNPATKQWYIPEGIDDTSFAKWLDNKPVDSANKPLPATKEKTPTSTLTAHTGIDDINAMLRDAVETNDDSSL